MELNKAISGQEVVLLSTVLSLVVEFLFVDKQ